MLKCVRKIWTVHYTVYVQSLSRICILLNNCALWDDIFTTILSLTVVIMIRKCSFFFTLFGTYGWYLHSATEFVCKWLKSFCLLLIINYSIYAKLSHNLKQAHLLSIFQGYYIFVLNLLYSLHVLEFLSLIKGVNQMLHFKRIWISRKHMNHH